LLYLAIGSEVAKFKQPQIKHSTRLLLCSAVQTKRRCKDTKKINTTKEKDKQ